MTSDDEIHEGGCLCGAVRYRTTGAPERAVACHCRYCQLRTGSAFGISVYFPDQAVEFSGGPLRTYEFTTESGRSFAQHFCITCGSSISWTLESLPGHTGIAGGTFDPPTHWYDLQREVFTRHRAPFAAVAVDDSVDTSSSYAPVRQDPARLR